MQFIQDMWGILLAGFGGLVWLLRLEETGKANNTEIRRLWAQRKEDLAAAKESRTEVHDTLAEIKHDIKELLKQR